MTDEDLLGYVIGALDPKEHVALEAQIHTRADLASRVDQLRLLLAPLAADKAPVTPPAGLALRTISRLAAHLVAEAELDVPRSAEHDRTSATGEPDGRFSHATPDLDRLAAFSIPASTMPRAPREQPETRTLGGRLRPDLLIACGIAFFACGLVFSALGKVRARNQLLTCQANLQTLHLGLSGYADTHDGHYPQVAQNATAESFATVLSDAGQVPSDYRPSCPAAHHLEAEAATPVSYTYTLGYQTPAGGLVGMRRPDGNADEHDLLPIAADYPTASATPGAGPLCGHPPLMNVLFAGGQVRMTTSPLIGPNGDDIYRNVFGRVAAGVDRSDVVLGRPGDRP